MAKGLCVTAHCAIQALLPDCLSGKIKGHLAAPQRGRSKHGTILQQIPDFIQVYGIANQFR